MVITDYGIAINPRRQDLIDCMRESRVKLPFCTIEELRDRAYAITESRSRFSLTTVWWELSRAVTALLWMW